MKIKYRIPKPNDTGKFSTTSFLLECTDSKKKLFPALWNSRTGRPTALNKYGEQLISTEKLGIGATRHMKEDPVLTSLRKSINKVLMPPHDTSTNFLNRISFKYIDVEVSILYSRRNKQ